MNLTNLPPLVADASLRASVVILLLLALRPRLRRFFGSAWVSLLWIAVLARLLFLWPVESRWSAFNLLPKAQPQAVTTTPWKVNVSVGAGAGQETRVAESTPPVPAEPMRQRGQWLVVAWAFGALGMFMYFGVRGWRTGLVARHAKPANDPRLRKVFETIPAGLRGRTTLSVTDEIPVPALAGFLRPQIWLPRAWLSALSDDELRHVLLHELGHARRGDLLVQWLFAFTQCLHWFNPLVWLAVRLARSDAELACDAWVLARSTEPERERYGGTLLKASQLFRTLPAIPPAAVGMASSRHALVARVRHVGDYRPVSRRRVLLGTAAAAFAAMVLMSNQISAQAPETSSRTPDVKAAADVPKSSATPAPQVSPKSADLVEIETKFIEMDESTLKKLSEQEPFFKEAAETLASSAHGKTPDSGGLGAWLLLSSSLPSSLSPGQFQKIMHLLGNTSGADLLIAPNVITCSGQQAKVGVTWEYHYPTAFELDKEVPGDHLTPTNFVTTNPGLTLDVTPRVRSDKRTIDLYLVPQVVEFLGFREPKKSREPVFSTSKIETQASLLSGQTFVFGKSNWNMETVAFANRRGIERKYAAGHILLLFVTAQVVDPNQAARPASSQGQPTTAAMKNPNMQIGVPVEGREGFVTSPYAPKAGPIDVRGFPKGTEVKDPYTGKIFLVP